MIGKTSFIKDANVKMVGERVEITGWVHQKRNIGKLIFLVLRDRSGEIQVIFKDLPPQLMKIARDASFEDVLIIRGELVLKKSKDTTDALEIIAEKIQLVSEAKTPPIIPTIIKETNENTRLKYRYLDLRSEEKRKMLLMRNNLQMLINKFMSQNSYLYVHTPLLAKATPEGARDFLIQSREYKGKFYALPQSPQIYKQLLMASGIERYYQIAASFRDEDARSDRHQEFYELDIEASYAKALDIINLVTKLMKQIVLLVMEKKDILKKVSFKKMSYQDAMMNYGTDKPDLRFDMKIEKAEKYFDKGLRSQLGIDKANSPILFLEKGNQIKDIETIINKLVEINNQHNYNRGFMIYWFSKPKDQLYLYKYLNGKGIKKKINLKDDFVPLEIVDNVLIIPKWQDKASEAWKKYSILSHFRSYWGKKYLLNKNLIFSFVWITNFPLFEKEKSTNKITSSHHPFTKPSSPSELDTLKDDELLNIKSTSFDLVCNGYELGSGSERITNPVLQEKIFKILNLEKDVIKKKFGFLLESMKYGTPPHAGIGLGFERILMVLLQTNNIRDVIPFPKTADGFELMTNSPTKI